MKNIVCITSINSVGCTFVDWSIHFLTGKDKFYSILSKDYIPLVENPLTLTNAHGHKKNHPSGLKETIHCLNIFESVIDQSLLSMYPVTLHADAVASHLKIPLNGQLSKDHHNQILNSIFADYYNLVNYCIDQNVKVIFISPNKNNSLYFFKQRHLDKLYFSPDKPISVEESQSHYDSVFFADSIKRWSDLNLTDIWDHRERMAISYNPFHLYQPTTDAFNYSKKHLWVDAQSLWFNGLHTIKKIMAYCDLDIDPARWIMWQPIYHHWQQAQLNILEFEFNYQHIVNSIVNNWYYDISNLTFDQEVIIQHCLIYQHNLNLKTWQLEKFPSNTQDLHKLLEPNIHPIETY